jgi:hypothetical protein
MDTTEKSLQIVGDYLVRFYHQEPDDTRASIKAIEAMIGHFEYEWQVSTAFKSVLESPFPTDVIRDFVRNRANRYARNDVEARNFLVKTFKENDLDKAIDLVALP